MRQLLVSLFAGVSPVTAEAADVYEQLPNHQGAMLSPFDRNAAFIVNAVPELQSALFSGAGLSDLGVFASRRR